MLCQGWPLSFAGHRPTIPYAMPAAPAIPSFARTPAGRSSATPPTGAFPSVGHLFVHDATAGLTTPCRGDATTGLPVRRPPAHPSLNIRSLCRQSTHRLGAVCGEVLSENAARLLGLATEGGTAAHGCVRCSGEWKWLRQLGRYSH